MKRTFVRILVWLGIMAVLTLLMMGAWLIVCGGSQSTASLKWLQLLQTIGTFLLPPIFCAWLWSDDHRPFVWLRMNRGLSWQTALLAIIIMVCAIPGINLLADMNSRIHLPECLASLEQTLRAQEDAAAALTERFLQADNLATMLLNVGLLALLPAFAEELSFRGTLQQIITNGQRPKANSHLAIWLTAFVFSAIHFQFYGFVPRMLMGAMFGYVFVWTGSLWAPILMHFTNNGVAVVSYYLMGDAKMGETWADTVGAGPMWWLGVLSIVVVGGSLYWLRRHNHSARYSCSG